MAVDILGWPDSRHKQKTIYLAMSHASRRVTCIWTTFSWEATKAHCGNSWVRYSWHSLSSQIPLHTPDGFLLWEIFLSGTCIFKPQWWDSHVQKTVLTDCTCLLWQKHTELLTTIPVQLDLPPPNSQCGWLVSSTVIPRTSTFQPLMDANRS